VSQFVSVACGTTQTSSLDWQKATIPNVRYSFSGVAQKRRMVRRTASVLPLGVAVREGTPQLRAGSALSLGQRHPGFRVSIGHILQRAMPRESRPFSALESLLNLLLLTDDPHPSSVLPSLALLSHTLQSAPTEASSLLRAVAAEVAIVDARTDVGGGGGGGGRRGPPARGAFRGGAR
jgi:hypothetical protein